MKAKIVAKINVNGIWAISLDNHYDIPWKGKIKLSSGLQVEYLQAMIHSSSQPANTEISISDQFPVEVGSTIEFIC